MSSTPSPAAPQWAAQTEAMQILRRMVRVLLHELKTPISGVAMSLEVMGQRMAHTRQQRAMVAEARKQLRSLNDTLDALGHFTQPWQLQRQTVEVSKVLQSLHDEAVPAWDHVRWPAASPGAITFDPHALKELCRHLLNNAVESSPEPQAVEVHTAFNAQSLTIQIIDQGAGLDPVVAEQAFEPFFTTKHRRLGLGLPLARRIAREHGGDVHLHPGRDSGTVAEVVLPLTPRTHSQPADGTPA